MSSLKSIDTAALIDLNPTDDIRRKADEAMQSAGMNGVKLDQMQARDLVGRYIAGVSVGNIQAELALHKEAVERCSLSASFLLGRIIREANGNELADVDVKDVSMLSEQINRCAQTFTMLAGIQLKTAETYGKIDGREKQKSNAPQLIATNMQVNITQSSKPKPVLDVSLEDETNESGEGTIA